jgi:hypothetical protein
MIYTNGNHLYRDAKCLIAKYLPDTDVKSDIIRKMLFNDFNSFCINLPIVAHYMPEMLEKDIIRQANDMAKRHIEKKRQEYYHGK